MIKQSSRRSSFKSSLKSSLGSSLRCCGAVALMALPLSALAGAGHVWSQKEQIQPPTSAVEQQTRNVAGGEPLPTTQGADRRVLSSTELGMHFTHGAGKGNSSTKVFVPNVTFWLPAPKQAAENSNVNKRALLLEAQQATGDSGKKAM